MKLLALASLLSCEVRGWAAILSGSGKSASEPGAGRMDMPALVSDGGEPLLSIGYAVVRLLEASGKLDDVLVSIGCLWPDRRRWAEAERARHAPSAQISELVKRLTDEDLTNITGRLQGEALEVTEIIEWGSIYDALWRRRAAFAAVCAASHISAFPREGLAVSLRLQEAATPLMLGEEADPTGLATGVRGYIRAEGLFPWMPYQGVIGDLDSEHTQAWNPYHRLFQASGAEGKSPMISASDIAATINISLDGEQRETIMGVVGRLEEALACGGYDRILDVICEDNALYGQDSIIASYVPLNVIPGLRHGECRPILVAFSARKKRGLVEPLPGTLRKVREHLIRCFRATKAVILVMDDWKPDAFAESAGDLAAHRDNGTIILPLVVNGNRLVPMTPPF